MTDALLDWVDSVAPPSQHDDLLSWVEEVAPATQEKRPGLAEQFGKTIADSTLEGLHTVGSMAAYLPFRLSRLLPEGKTKDAITKMYRDAESQEEAARKSQAEALALPPAEGIIEKGIRGVAGIIPFAAATAAVPGAGIGVGMTGVGGAAVRAAATGGRWAIADQAMGGEGANAAEMGAGFSLIESLPLPRSAKFFLESGGMAGSTYWATGDIEEAIAMGSIPGIFRAGRWTARAAKEVKDWAMSPEGAKQIAQTPEGHEYASKEQPTRADVESVLGKGIETSTSDRANLAKAVRNSEVDQPTAPVQISKPEGTVELAPEVEAPYRGKFMPDPQEAVGPSPRIQDLPEARIQDRIDARTEDRTTPRTEDRVEPTVEDRVDDTIKDRISNLGEQPDPEIAASAEEKYTSIKNAYTVAERELRGMPARVFQPKRDVEEDMRQVALEIAENPDLPIKLIEELGKKPRPVDWREDLTLLYHQQSLEKAYAREDARLKASEAAGDSAGVNEATAKLKELNSQIETVYDVVERVGTENALGLGYRQWMAKNDFTLARMLNNARVANEGPLSPEQEAEIRTFQRGIEDAQTKLEERLAAAEAKLQDLETRRLFDSAKGRAPARTKESWGSRNRIVSVERAAQAKASIGDYFRKRATGEISTLNIDPAILKEAVVLGAHHIEAGAREIGAWTRKMVEELGDEFKPFAEQVHKLAQTEYANESSKIRGSAIAERVKAGKPLIEMRREIRELALEAVREGAPDRDAMVDSVHEVIKGIDPNVTREQVVRAITGYGEFKPLDPEATKATYREYRGELLLVEKLETVEKEGKPPLKTGSQRQPLSEKGRRLDKQVREAVRKAGFKTTDPATQLRSALESIKTRLNHEIADLDYQITTRERIVKEKTPSPTDAEVESLRAKRDLLREQFNDIFGKKEMTDEQRQKIAMDAVKRSIAEYDRRISEQDFGPRRGRKTPSSPDLERLRLEREERKAEYEHLRDSLHPELQEQANLAAYKNRLLKNTIDLHDKIMSNDLEPKAKREMRLDDTALYLKAENARMKALYRAALEKYRLANRSTAQKIFGGIGETFNLSRALITSMDLSAPLRQGAFIVFPHPIRSLHAFKAMFQALRSEQGMHRVDAEIQSRPNFRQYVQGGLYLTERGQPLARLEEAYMSRWADKIPIVKATARAYGTFLNRLRADTFDAMARAVKPGELLSPIEAKAIANFINVATGRGNIVAGSGLKANALITLNSVFFAPRYVASRFQLIAGQPMYRGTLKTRLLVAKEYAHFMGAIGLIYGLASLDDDATVELDWRSSDFGKIKYGNTRIDLMGGLAQTSTYLGRTITGETKNQHGQVVPLVGKGVKFGGQTWMDVQARFLRTKLSPIFGTAVNLRVGENVVGEPVTPTSVASELTVPLAFRDIYAAMKDQGIPKGTALGLLAILGAGMNTYDASRKKKSTLPAVGNRFQNLQLNPR